MIRLKTLFPTAALIASMPAAAQMAPADTLADHTLDQVVVTGTRTPKSLLSTPVQTLVISGDDIRKADATDLRDLLSQVLPGVEFSYAMNQQTHMNFAGFGGQSVLVLVDGQRLAGETMDDVDFARLDMQNVDHIEIVKSAASALYGSNAAGGVINIITKDAAATWHANVNARIGRHGQQRYGLSAATGGNRWSTALTASRTAADNYNVSSGPNPVSRVVSTIYGDETWNVSDATVYRPSDRWKMTARGGYFFRQTKRSPDTPERYRDFSGSLRAEGRIGSKGNIDVNYVFDQYDKSDYQRIARLDIRGYSNVQNSLRALYTHTFGAGNILSAGADYMHDYLYNSKLSGNTRRQDFFDAFAQYDWTITDRLETVAALRYDWFSDGPVSRLTPKVSLRYTPFSGMNIRIGYGMGFRAPTLKEKYYDFDMAGIWIVEGNSSLKPEKSHNFNISAEYNYRNYSITVGGCCNSIRDKIGTGAPYFTTTDDMPRLPYINLDTYHVMGLDATLRARWQNGLSARLSYAYVDERLPKDKEGHGLSSEYLPARKHSVVAHADWDHRMSKWYALNIGIDGHYYSGVDNEEFADYYDVSRGTNVIHYPAYSLWRLQMVNSLGKAVKLTVTVDNIFNYRPDYYYLNAPRTDGTNVMVGLSVDIDKLF